ncbi:hypothetical protein HF1_07570 [Mycoplasma haemofelis str. Langford 1]|uniref:Uncharacterized protein n=1 Tax=Mycoplasma haemofelis (strain Langford 1) TaxID=941640 RepID=E8ZHZ4_MYCHL|nr:hypothetical protein [Mycoplasma haemofelis]CBY92765.1 hypothetical protein HF1_07570 [Mycoplasma haemofelis str. Langford 1]
MAISGVLKAATAGILGAVGTGGAVYFGSKALSSSDSKEEKSVYTFRDKFAGRLVTSVATDNQWKVRLDKLTQEKSKSPQKKGLPESTTQADLHQWCVNTSSMEFDANREEIFESFCVLMNKERITGTLIQSGGTWSGANSRLGAIEDSKLSQELKGIRDKVKVNSASGKELETWCVSKYELPFREDKDFEYVELYCTEVKQATSAQASPSGS